MFGRKGRKANNESPAAEDKRSFEEAFSCAASVIPTLIDGRNPFLILDLKPVKDEL
jgi:hypothetical protein